MSASDEPIGSAPALRLSYPRVLRYFASTRGLEVAVLQASPLLGAWLGGFALSADSAGQLALLLIGSVALTASVFVTNDWAGYPSDASDPRRAAVAHGSIARSQIAWLSVLLLVLAFAALAAVSAEALLLGGAIATLSAVYSLSPSLGKERPFAASLNHLIGGSLHFLLGYTLVQPVDARGLGLSLFFGLVFAAGHLNQEVRDYEFDHVNGTRTAAVVYGVRAAFLASFALFSLAYALVLALAATGRLPLLLLAVLGLWLAQAVWTLAALRRGLGAETAVWMQRRYRLLFALVGLAMLVR